MTWIQLIDKHADGVAILVLIVCVALVLIAMAIFQR